MHAAGAHRRPAAAPAWRLWRELRRVLAACWPGWGSALGVVVWLAYMVLVYVGWLS